MGNQMTVSDLKSSKIWIEALTEFLGTGFLVLLGCGSVANGDVTPIALTFGLTIALLVNVIGPISGCNINPAITLAELVMGNYNIAKVILYIIAQCIGAICGAAVLYCLIQSSDNPNLGTTSLGTGVRVVEGVFIEFLITFILLFSYFTATDPNRPEVAGKAPFIIGTAIAVSHFWAVRLTGSSMNPARSLGPAVVANYWSAHWIYWVGPLVGGVCASLFYRFLAKKKAGDQPPEVGP